MPSVGRYARPEFEQFSNLASSQLTLDQWVALSRRINQLFKEDPGVAGIVVTSGTDTLEELAYSSILRSVPPSRSPSSDRCGIRARSVTKGPRISWRAFASRRSPRRAVEA